MQFRLKHSDTDPPNVGLLISMKDSKRYVRMSVCHVCGLAVQRQMLRVQFHNISRWHPQAPWIGWNCTLFMEWIILMPIALFSSRLWRFSSAFLCEAGSVSGQTSPLCGAHNEMKTGNQQCRDLILEKGVLHGVEQKWSRTKQTWWMWLVQCWFWVRVSGFWVVQIWRSVFGFINLDHCNCPHCLMI